MTPSSLLPLGVAVLVLAATAAGLDLYQVETHTLVVYSTPALKDVLERLAIPAFKAETGIDVVPVYLNAAEEYYRVRLSEGRPEADVMVHASPLFLEKGYMAGIIEPMEVDPDLGLGNQSRPVPGGRVWHAFAWSPLVEVHRPGDGPVDLAVDGGRFGFAHPLLSNNGIYNVLFFEALDPAAGRRALERTVVQPVNARTTVGGVADGSFDLTLGYEAVVRFYQERGARVEASVPVVGGQNATTPVLFSASLVRNHPHPGAEEFVATLFSRPVQDGLARFAMRPIVPDAEQPQGLLDLSGARVVQHDWSQWEALERKLPLYEVTD